MNLQFINAADLVGHWINGHADAGAGARQGEVFNPAQGRVARQVALASRADVDRAVAAARAAFTNWGTAAPQRRARVMFKFRDLVDQYSTDIAKLLSAEHGKTLPDALGEVQRGLEVIEFACGIPQLLKGEFTRNIGPDIDSYSDRQPLGVVAGITPFNAPFNLACHKIGPAIAAGNVIVLKAPPQAPWVVSKLVELFADAGTPPGFVNLLYGNTVGPALVRDARVDFVTFTGSSRVGAEIKAASGLRRVALELGGNGSTIVHSDASVDAAAPQCARNSMRLAGQSCTSVQNVYVHESLYEQFVACMLREVKTMRLGDPLDPATDVGTLVDEAAAKRVEAWVGEAIAKGARALCGARRHGAAYEPTVLVDVEPSMRVVCEEVFGPVVSVQRYRDLPPLFERISAEQYGLHCGIFTKSIQVAFDAIRALRVGGIIVNGTSTWRTDQLAYGGVKSSGIGREGPRYAMRDMTEERLVLFNL